MSVIQVLPLERVGFLRPLGKRALAGWQILNITTLTSGSPFSVYSGIQQTGAGSAGRTGRIRSGSRSSLTRRTIREDYFGRAREHALSFRFRLTSPAVPGPTRAASEPWDEIPFSARIFTTSIWLYQRHSLVQPCRLGARQPRVSCRVLQRLQSGDVWIAFQHPARFGLRGHQPYRGDFPPDSVLAEAALLIAVS